MLGYEPQVGFEEGLRRGVALNCVANGKLLCEGLFDHIWIQPAAGDAGGALGAAYAAHHIWQGAPRDVGAERPGGGPHQHFERESRPALKPDGRSVARAGRSSAETCPSVVADRMRGSLLGPAFNDADVERVLCGNDASATRNDDFDALCTDVAAFLDDGKVIGWFQGRMEWGPRALGNRSILGDPRRPDTQKTLNLKIKYREGFRPFAPSVLIEDSADYFELQEASPYMLLVAPVRESRRKPLPEGATGLKMLDRLYHPRSDVPAITHVDYSARIQTVHRDTNERYWKLINAFKERTGCGMVVNTSFNVRGEPIVCTPNDAYRCFMRTEMDYLVVGNWLFAKTDQPAWDEKDEWAEEFVLD